MKTSFILFLIALFFSCKNPVNDGTYQKKKAAYFACIESQIKSNKFYSELKNFEKYLEDENIIVSKDGNSYIKLFNPILNKQNGIDSILKNYKYDFSYEMEFEIADSCVFEISNEDQIKQDSLNYYMEEELYEKVIDLSQKIFSTLDQEILSWKGFQLSILNRLYQNYQNDKIKNFISLKLFVTSDSIFIEKEYTTLANLKENLSLKVKEKKEELAKYGFQDEAYLEMRINPDVKMGKVQAIKTIIKEIGH